MNSFIDKLRVLLALPKSLYFNLRYLPLSQAIRLPILLYKPSFGRLAGRIEIVGKVSTGMVRLGFRSVSIYPERGIMIENHGGLIRFCGRCFIGSGSAISIGKNATLTIGDGLMANARARMIVYDSVTFGDNCRLAWETMVMDTDMHALTRPDGSLTQGHGMISIGNNCWLGTGCIVQKNTVLPPFTTVQARTVLSKNYDIPPRCVIGPDTIVKIKAQNTWRDLNNDKISYRYKEGEPLAPHK